MIDTKFFTARMCARTLKASWHALGFRWTAVNVIILGFFLANRACLGLDDLFFRKYRNVEIRKPVFIIGHPRSGTTFLHRLLTQTGEFPAFKSWELLVPSLTMRRLLAPFVELGMKLLHRHFHDPSTFAEGDAHVVTPESVEEEELLFLLRFDTQLVRLLTPFGFEERDHQELIFHDRHPDSHRLASVRYLEQCLKRQVLQTGKTQILTKMPYSTLRIKTLLEVFPDARFIYIVRSPFETIPSHLSLHRGIFQQRYGIHTIPKPVLERYYARRYRDNVALYRYFYDLCQSGELKPDRYMLLEYDRLRTSLLECFDELVAFAGIQPSLELRKRVAEQSEQQRTYKRAHRNLDPADFGLSWEQIARDLDFVFEAYGLDPEPPAKSMDNSRAPAG